MSDAKSPEAKKVGTVKAIRLYPVKSLKCVDLLNCECTFKGLVEKGFYDREWMVILNSSKSMVTARMKPKMVLITTVLTDQGLKLQAPGMDDLLLRKDVKGAELETKVWGQKISGIDSGDEAAAWIDRFLDKPSGTYRIIYSAPNMRKRTLVHQDDEWLAKCKIEDQVQYQDGFPYMLISSASLKALNDEVCKTLNKTVNLPMHQFRPNIEVDGCEAFAEDEWDEIYIGNAKFANKKPCGRCIFTTINPEIGEKSQDEEPLKTMKRIRPQIEGDPAFGINLVAESVGNISVGDDVYATIKKK